ncbi:MAG: AAA family ATPase [Candidatus Pacearchaeota archaeon]
MSKVTIDQIRNKFLKLETEMNEYLYERTDPIRGLSLGILSSSNVLLLGPPGTAKSMVVREWTKRIINARYFEWLITRFSTPEELLGPISFEGLKNDRHIRVTANKLPESNLAFLDEIFKGNAGILNSLLTIMNERIFFNGPNPQKIPLYCVIGSSNEIPDEEDGLD